MKTSRLFVSSLVVLAGVAPLSAQPNVSTKIIGLSQQIQVVKATEVKVAAPAGAFVAVLDQSLSRSDPKASKSQDHHNGWLEIGAIQPGEVLTVTGKLFVPTDAEHKPSSLRFTVRQRSKTGLVTYVDRSLKVSADSTGRWTDFSIELPVKNDESLPVPERASLLLSAVPFAGPVYLDDLKVVDSSGKQLWAYPSFE